MPIRNANGQVYNGCYHRDLTLRNVLLKDG